MKRLISSKIAETDDLGNIVITISKDLRHHLGIHDGDMFSFEAFLNDDGTILIQKQTPILYISGEIDRIKNAVLDNEAAEDIREEVFKHLNSIEELIKTVRE